MPSNFWSESAVAKINSRFIDCDSEHEHIRQRSEAILCQEIGLCMHIGATHVLVDMPSKSDRNENFSAILNRMLQQNMPHLKIILRLTVPGDDAQAEKLYRRYVDVKQMVDSDNQLNVCLSIGPDLPQEKFFRKLIGERVYSIQLCTSAFVSNNKGFPVLPQIHQQVV